MKPPGANSRGLPFGVCLLAAIHVASHVCIWRWPETVDRLMIEPTAIATSGHLWRLASGIFFCAGGWQALGVTLVALIWFGMPIECRLGFSRFVALYICGGIALGIVWVLATLPWGWRMPLGISGSMTLLGFLQVLHGWRAPLWVLPAMALPAWIPFAAYAGAIGWLCSNALPDLSAHLGGLVAALVAHQLGVNKSARPKGGAAPPRRTSTRAATVEPPIDSDADRRDAKSTGTPPDPDFNARVDRLLAKISETGYDSLTEEEILLLLEASQRYRDRRG